MAGTRDHTKSNYYHQTIELHLDIGAEVLRKIISNELNKTGSSLKDYLKTKHVKKILSNLKYNKVLFPQQWKLLYPSSNQDPDSSCFDTSLLTLLIVETNFSLSRDEIQKAKDLRRERNHMSHLPKAELNDKTHFNVTSNILTELSAMISKTFTDKMKRLIDHLQKREFVIRRSILDVVNIRNEELMVLMIDRPDDKTGNIFLLLNIYVLVILTHNNN